ncbi:glycyl radical enzyme [Luteitalea sp. TBR-22]|uniref:glycyl radical protein n=1 Tax=Luteitalea sp. TBR-22 TaxID=2802971 RepID=UPI001AF729FD|nr:pyruvate formate lyase family protein [Luteitalea sp. TBR-22]BCS32057.1 glycyl radical enzyme [Luteitalea sp. TBR-22]
MTEISAQERAIAEGRKVLHGKASDRVLRMFDAIRAYGPPRVALERAVYFTESFKATEGQPLVLRWARALHHIAEHISVTILDDELIVGRPNTWLGRYSLVYPELDGTIIQAGAQAFIAAKGAPDAVTVTDDDKRIIDEVLFPYWNGKDFTPNFIKALPPETRHFTWGSDPANVGTTQTFVIVSTSTMRHSQNWVPDFAKMLTRGCKGLREEAQARLAALDDPRDLAFRKPFYEAAIITCDALSLLARRYSEEAAALAARATDPQRRKELEEIAAICAWVPENPARTFREAMQAQWFTQLFSRFEEMVGGQVNQGRMDQYLYPTYRKDLEEGRITPEDAQELFQCLWLNMMQSIESQMSPSAAKGREGFSHHETVTIGGQTPDGLDATNELSYLILESTRPLRSSYPELGVRIHAGTPDRFLHAVAETIKDGKGSPKMINDEFVVPWFLSNGIVKKEALDYAMSGCSESRLPNRETHKTGNAGINYGAVMEMTLRDGRMKIYDDEQFGLKTGDPRTFATYDDVWNAFRLQLENVTKHIMIQNYIAAGLKPRYIAAPLASTLHDLCMEAGRDLHTHADYIPGALDASCIDGLGGFATCIDSLAAIKHLIFDTKKLTWDQLLEALEVNWQGREAVRQLCLNAPKYGNGIEWVDAIGYRIQRTVMEYAHAHPRPHGQSANVRIIPITFHNPCGKVTMATPNGRPAGEYLSDGIVPSHGCDTKGPTVTLQSIARATCHIYKEHREDLLNMKIAPANVAGEEGTRRLMQLIRAWSSQKHAHIQFNVLSKQALLEAQKDPEKYRDLVVRVAGYCAYFTELSPSQQAEIIARTEQVN